MQAHFWAVALSAMLALSGTAHAGQDLYNNINAVSGGTDAVTDNGPMADSFSTGASAFTLTDVSLLLEGAAPPPRQGIPPEGSITVYLLSDSGTSPGSTIATLGTLLDSAVGASLAVYDFTTDIVLAADTRYWIEVVAANGSQTQWSWSQDLTGTGVANEYFSNVNGVWANNPLGGYQMEIADNPSPPVPEPAGWTVLLVGGAFMAARRARRPARTSAASR
jgi:hypothetical protein